MHGAQARRYRDLFEAKISLIDTVRPVGCRLLEIWSYHVNRAFPCGNLRLDSGRDWTFVVVVYVNHRQRETEERLAERIGDRMLVGEVQTGAAGAASLSISSVSDSSVDDSSVDDSPIGDHV